MKVTRRLWGVCEEQAVYLFNMESDNGLCAAISNYGGIVQRLFTTDASGHPIDIVLGYDSLEEYRSSETFFGAMIGPIADRVVGGSCQLAEVEVQLPRNSGTDCVHSGPRGFHSRVWNWKILDKGIELSHEFLPEESSLPGKLKVKLRYLFDKKHTLRLEYDACCDRETAVSFTNHSYFNLSGVKRDCREYQIMVHANHYAETEREINPICTGRVLPVEGTPMDLCRGVRLGDVLEREDFGEIRTGGGLDHYFLVDGQGMREHGRITCRESGLTLICCSDAPGVLVYSANGLSREHGKYGQIYDKNWAVCMETERFPNAVSIRGLKNQVLLRPGEQFKTCTEFCLTKSLTDMKRCYR